MIKEEFCNSISSLCIRSILFEVSASPKPGLVDRYNSGAHKDMDIFTFMTSSSVLYSYFHKCAQAGIYFQGNNYRHLLKGIRPLGIRAEEAMFRATEGVNTHKGLIFSLGIIAASAGSLFNTDKSNYYISNNIANRVQLVASGVTEELKKISDKKELTYGEALYQKYETRGIRGEVEGGFPTVYNHSLPIFTKLMEENKFHINDILVHTLLYLIAYTEDSNILGRQGLEELIYAQNQAKNALDLGGFLTKKGKEAVMKMDKEFIRKNISPGGAADLLAVTFFIYYLGKRLI